jgi:signal transduction histidine kinase
MGFIFFKSGQYQSAIQALTRSIELNDQFNRGLKIKATCENILAKIYEKTGDYRAALEHTKRHIQYANSMALKEKYDQIANLEKRYESEKKEREIERLAAQQQITLIRLRKNKQLKELGIAGVALLLLLAFLIWLKYLDKKKTNIVLEEKNKVIVQSEHELRVLNASKNKFFSIIAHDLKNPLHTVLGYADLLNKEYDRFGDEDRRKFAHHIYQSTNNIFRLLQNLLEWSRTQTGRMNFSPAIVEYQRLLDNSLNVLKALADQKNIVIKTGNDPELKIFADPFMIETVLRNLINNAIKFTPEGGQIEVSAKKADGQVVVSVSDTGIGISEEETQNLFRIDSKVKRKGTNNEEGTGLGLILCHEFVSRHHGKIWVESTPGKGSEFIFSIPAKATA